MSADQISPGERRYRLRCIEKLGHDFRGDESLLDAGCYNPLFYAHMALRSATSTSAARASARS